jgi:hypothetical protein
MGAGCDVSGAAWIKLTARDPTPLDALIAAYVWTSRDALQNHPDLLQYADRVLDVAEGSLHR